MIDAGMNLETKLMFQRIIGNDLILVDKFHRKIIAMKRQTTALIITLAVGFFYSGILMIVLHRNCDLLFAVYMYCCLYIMSRQWERCVFHLAEQEKLKNNLSNLYVEVCDSIDNHEGE